MPFKISDEALDALDRAGNDERVKFFGTLSDDERSQIAAALPAWKAKKQAPVAPAPAPVDMSPSKLDTAIDSVQNQRHGADLLRPSVQPGPLQKISPEPNSTQLPDGFDVNGEPKVQFREDVMGYKIPVLPDGFAEKRFANMEQEVNEHTSSFYRDHPVIAHALGLGLVKGLAGAKTLGQDIYGPAVSEMQHTFGSPAVEGVIEGVNAVANIPSKIYGEDVLPPQKVGSDKEYLLRSSLQWMGGPEALEKMPVPAQLEALWTLEKAYGVNGAAFAQGFATIGGASIPMLFVNPGAGAVLGDAAESAYMVHRGLTAATMTQAPLLTRLMVQSAKTLGSSIGTGIEGGIMGGGQAMLTGQDIGEGIKMGMASGALLDLGMNAGSMGLQVGKAGVKRAAIVVPSVATKILHQELPRLIDTFNMTKAKPLASDALGGHVVVPEGTMFKEAKPGTVPVSSYVVHTDPKGDLKLYGININAKSGKWTITEEKLNPTDYSLLKRRKQESGVTPVLSPEARPLVNEGEWWKAIHKDKYEVLLDKVGGLPEDFLPEINGKGNNAETVNGRKPSKTDDTYISDTVVRPENRVEITKNQRAPRLDDPTMIDEPVTVIPDTEPVTAVDVHPDGRLEFKSLDDFEAFARNQPTEHAAVKLSDGRIHYSKNSGKSPTGVDIGEETIGLMRADPEHVLSHNHPNNSNLSPEDIEAAIRMGSREIRAVGPDGYVWRLRRDLQGWEHGGSPSSYIQRINFHMRSGVARAMEELGYAGDKIPWKDPKFGPKLRQIVQRTLREEGINVEFRRVASKALSSDRKAGVVEYDPAHAPSDLKLNADSDVPPSVRELREKLDALQQENNRLKGEDTDPGVPDFIPGEEVYWRPQGTTDGHTVDYLGKSPNDPDGHTALIRVNGQVKEVPWEQVFPKNPWGFDRAPLAPPPPESPSPYGAAFAALDPQLNAKAEVATKFIKAMGELKEKQPSLWARAFKNHAAKAGGDIEAIINRVWSIGRAGDGRAIGEELRKLVTGKESYHGLDNTFDRDLARTAEGNMKYDELLQKYPKEVQKLQQHFKPYLEEIQRDFDMNAQLMKDVHDGVIDLPTYQEIMGYLARSYRAYTLPPGEWAKQVPEQVMIDAANYILKNSKVKMTEGQLIGELSDILNTEDPMAGLLNMGVGNKAWKNLKHREQIPFVIRKLMGEETSGAIRLTNTLAKLRALNAGLEAMGQIVKGGTLAHGIDANPLWSPGRRADLHPEPVPNNRMLYGKAAGGYIHKDLWPIVEAIQHAKSPFKTWQQLAGLTKANLVALGGVGPWLNAAMGNWMWNGMLHGQLSPWRPAKTAHYLGRALGDFHASGEMGFGDYNASTNNPAVQRVLMAKKYGADVLGMHGNELMPPGSPFYKHLQERLGGANAPKTPAEWISVAAKAAAEGINKGYGKASHYYDFIDRSFRYGSFLADFDEMMASGKYTEHEAATEAARRVNRYFPNASHPNPVAAAFRASPAGFLARFSFDFTEQLRIMGNVVEDLKKKDRALIGRLGAGGLMGLSIWQGNKFLRRMNGITDKEVNGNFDQQSDTGQSTYTPLAMALPWKDSQGRVQRIDPGNFFWWAKLAKLKPDNSKAVGIPVNMILEMANGGTSEHSARQLFEISGLGDFTMPDRKVRPWEKGVPALVSLLMREGGVPGVAMRGYDALKGAGVVGQPSPFKEQMTPTQAAMYLLGIPGITPMGDKNYKASKTELQQGKKEFKSNLINAKKELKGEDRKEAKQLVRDNWKHEKQQKHERSEAHKDTKEN